MDARIVEALDAWAASCPTPDVPLLYAGRDPITARSFADGYRTGDRLITRLVDLGVDEVGVDGFVASLTAGSWPSPQDTRPVS